MRKLRNQQFVEPREILEIKGTCGYCGEEMSMYFEENSNELQASEQCVDCGGVNYISVSGDLWVTTWRNGCENNKEGNL